MKNVHGKIMKTNFEKKIKPQQLVFFCKSSQCFQTLLLVFSSMQISSKSSDVLGLSL